MEFFKIIFVLALMQHTLGASVHDSRIFNVQFYSNFYHDLQNEYMNDIGAYRTHWEQEGLKQGRQAVATFCAPQYEELNNLSSIFNHNYTALALHYLDEGYALGLKGFINGENGRYTLENSVVSVGVSDVYAGAIDSIFYKTNNEELIQAISHNRQVQHTFAIDGHGECFRPTESGNYFDNDRNSSSVINYLNSTGDSIFTSIYPAFYVPPGYTLGCGPPINTAVVSRFLLTKKITIGFGGMLNVIRCDSTVTPNIDAFLEVEGPASFYSTQIQDVEYYNFSSQNYFPGTNPDYPSVLLKGTSAVTIFDPSDSLKQPYLEQINLEEWCDQLSTETGVPILYSFYIIVGTKNEVKDSIDNLVSFYPNDCSINNGGCDILSTCTNIGLQRICGSCPDGYIGTGNTTCIAFCENPCVNGLCSSPNNCTCFENYTGADCSILKERNCLVNNGGCDPRVKCINDRCESCPNGTYGYPETGCSLLCGNGICDTEVENCLLCPQDCRNVSCDLCGDLFCGSNIGEDCNSCFDDCGPCVETCSNGCSGNGKCHQGLCICDYPWNGPTCSTSMSEDIDVTVDGGNININSQKQFVVSIKNIEEIDQQGKILRNILFSDINFTLVDNEVTGKNSHYNFSATLDNGAHLNFIIRVFKEEQTIFNFANSTTSFPAQTVKFNLKVQRWPFYSISNFLSINLDAKSNNQVEDDNVCVNDKKDEKENVKWFMLSVDGISLYGQFLDKLIIDGRVRPMSFKQIGDTTVSAIIPHFWDYADMDPHYSVLLGDINQGECDGSDNDDENSKLFLIIVIVVPIVVGLILIIGVSIFTYPRLKLWYQLRGKKKLSVRSTEL